MTALAKPIISLLSVQAASLKPGDVVVGVADSQSDEPVKVQIASSDALVLRLVVEPMRRVSPSSIPVPVSPRARSRASSPMPGSREPSPNTGSVRPHVDFSGQVFHLPRLPEIDGGSCV